MHYFRDEDSDTDEDAEEEMETDSESETEGQKKILPAETRTDNTQGKDDIGEFNDLSEKFLKWAKIESLPM